ncbi:cupredoxin domain-containing protein [Paracoccus benzoatiresistens]|uniref:Plastocyanin/azurin family copper-binding protein n=1 Tax=Paracoccus benzoatiresistens TaxID=2997341 RepID=A0ABT4JBM0_9RHOB|nr:plastocyanin/azurin family copper-binding protein [Paracoccus sp. EF6]MCZ0964484.1 plastocyanin/azurin family copper-binding protein [Paracoccus sp. EF6]
MNRRMLITWGVALLWAAQVRPRRATAAGPLMIEMKGSLRGEKVWFVPLGLAVDPGAMIRFVNRDAGNSHTATAYHPDILDRPQRIPNGAQPWDSDLLLPDEAFEITLTVPGVYDLYCQPHEHAGMVARIVVGRPGQDPGWQGPPAEAGDLPEAALAAFPPVDDILAQGAVMPGPGEKT